MKNHSKVLIIGNLGYVGSVLGEFLHRENIDIYGIDPNWFGSPEFIQKNSIFIKKQWLSDIRDVVDSKEIWSIKYDAVIYLAAVSNDPMGKTYANVTQKINAEYCIKVANKAKNCGIKKLIFASSCSMYGKSDDNFPDENSELSPMTEYSKSKAWAEKELEKIADESFNVIALRFATACGSSKNLRLDLVLNDLVASAVKNKKVEVLSDGTPWRPLIHVKDMSRSFLWALRHNIDGVFLPINVGSKEFTFQVKDLAQLVVDLVPEATLVIAKDKAIDSRSYKVNFSYYEKLASEKYYPKFDAKKSIIDLIDHISPLDIPENFRETVNWMRLKMLEDKISRNKMDLDLNLIR